TLVSEELAQHGTRDVDAAELLDLVVGNSVFEYVAPGIGERPKRCGHMSPDGLAFRPRRSFPCAPFEFGDHGRILNGLRIDITNTGFRHWHFSRKKCHCAPASDAAFLVWRRVSHVAVTPLHEQRWLLHSDNRALAL